MNDFIAGLLGCMGGLVVMIGGILGAVYTYNSEVYSTVYACLLVVAVGALIATQGGILAYRDRYGH